MSDPQPSVGSPRVFVLEPVDRRNEVYCAALFAAGYIAQGLPSAKAMLNAFRETTPDAAVIHLENDNEMLALRRLLDGRVPYVRIGYEASSQVTDAKHSDPYEYTDPHLPEPESLALVVRLLLESRRPGGERPISRLMEPPSDSEPGLERDPVTKFYPFATFRPLLVQEIKRASRYRYPLSILLVTFDKFGETVRQLNLNDSRIFVGGIALAVSQTIRDVDWPVEYGEGKVLLLLPHTDLKGARVASQRVCEAVRLAVYETSAKKFSVTASIGGASYNGRGNVQFGELIRFARRNLERAIRDGGDRVVFHS